MAAPVWRHPREQYFSYTQFHSIENLAASRFARSGAPCVVPCCQTRHHRKLDTPAHLLFEISPTGTNI